MTTKLPLLISLPHAGLNVPSEVADICQLSAVEIVTDGDEGAAEIYSGLEEKVACFVTSDIARAIVDLNRAPDDFSRDGVIKTHTCYNQAVYTKPPTAEQRSLLLNKYYFPFHQALREGALQGLALAIDCHTMAACGPPIGPDPGQERPMICLSNGDGTCPDKLFHSLASCLGRAFGCEVSLNHPFRGGYITRHHSQDMNWIQLEISRTAAISNDQKAVAVEEALTEWVSLHQA